MLRITTQNSPPSSHAKRRSGVRGGWLTAVARGAWVVFIGWADSVDSAATRGVSQTAVFGSRQDAQFGDGAAAALWSETSHAM